MTTGVMEKLICERLQMELPHPGSGGMGFLIGCKDSVTDMKRDIDTYIALSELA